VSDYKLNLISKIVTAVSGLGVSVVLARYLGLVLRGEFAYVLQLSGVLAIVLGMGLNQAFPYYYRRRPVDETYHEFVRLFAIQFVIYSLAAVVLCVVVRNESVVCLVLLLVSTVLYQQMESAMAAYNIRMKIGTNIVGAIGRLGAHIVMVVWLPASLLAPTVISASVWLLMPGYYLVRTARFSQGRVSLGYAREIGAFSWLPMVSALLLVANYNFDTVMLKWLGSARDLGNYAVASGIVVYLWMVSDAIKEVMVSRLVRSRDPRVVLMPLKAALAASLAGVLVVAAGGDFVIPRVFGPDFADSYKLCVILVLGVLSMVYFKILGTYVLADGRRIFYFTVLAVAVILNVAVNLFAIPAFGAMGAAWTCVLSYSVTGVAFVVYFRRVTEIPWRELLWLSPSEARRMGSLIFGG